MAPSITTTETIETLKHFAGRDATTAFLSYHRKKFPHNKVSFALEGIDPTVSEKDIRDVDEDYLELCRRVHRVIPRHKNIRSLALLWAYTWYYASSIGLCYALIGLNIQHDGNHGAVSSKPWLNRLAGLSMNFIGHSSVDWVHQHDVQHHIYTNDVDLDPDIDGTPLLSSQSVEASSQDPWPSIYLLFYDNQSLRGHCELLHFEKYWKLEALGPMLLILRMYIIPIIRVPSIWTVLNIFLLMGTFGQYVAFFFILSHNYVGVHHTQGETKTKSFIYKQVACSSNVGGKLLCFFNGGLNYQIEHHLFPRMCHVHYPTVAPIVRQFCKEKSIPYNHFPTITENFVSTAEHLLGLGTEIKPTTMKFL
ncbi:E1.14.19.3 [Lepeophtheirus salmonis]|uniref:E1.14.19.3 n=1 Tax=Lepeophtheirus salmonis TaxID=72036 RepID=A0A7R8D6H1_LEPSM|nr:E1.14.19.3 [Lepeophtheirus salmonis]CAF3044804.1 E1.14.19.3 [Lepeophtheirus salmonis]